MPVASVTAEPLLEEEQRVLPKGYAVTVTPVIPAPVDLSVTRPEIVPWLVIVAATVFASVFNWSDSRGCGQICPSFTVVAAVAAEVKGKAKK